jgi:quinol monooxygenase YgiN
MTTLALYVRLEAKPGKEEAIESLLKDARSIVADEPGTTAWFALRLGPSTFAIFDAFPDEKAREAHINGKVGAKLMETAPDLFANQLDFIRVGVVADKLPG